MRRDQLNRRIHQTSAAAKAERPPSPQIIQRGRAVRAGGGGGVRKAFAKTAAPASWTITCFLDEDTTGTEIDVVCEVADNAALNSAVPRLSDGTMITVWNDAGTWRSVMTFQASGAC
jgi:hypothetical protein